MVHFTVSTTIKHFDALGRRISKTVDGVLTYFFYDSQGRVIAEYEDGTLQREYVYGNGFNEVLAMFLPEYEGNPAHWNAFMEFVDAWLCHDPNACYDGTYDHNSDGKINLTDFAYFASVWDMPSSTESQFYYLHDALGSVRGLIGGIHNREEDREFYNYDAYGRSSDASTVGNPYRFAGYRYDAETSLYHTDNRTYDPGTGRWLQFDPIGNADSMNLYEYVVSNPIMSIDPLGLFYMVAPSGAYNTTPTPRSLSAKITELLLMRAARGVAVPFNIYNRFRNDYSFEDELDEMNQVFGGDIERYYIDVLIHKRHSLSGEKWHKVNFPPPPPNFHEWSPGLPAVSEIPGLGFWLGGPHQVTANGCFDAKCCGTKCTIKNIKTNFEWRDQIDANSFIELRNKPAGLAEKVLEGGLGDIIGDKLLGMSYYITIRWKHVDKSERNVNIESRLKRQLERNQK